MYWLTIRLRFAEGLTDSAAKVMHVHRFITQEINVEAQRPINIGESGAPRH